MTLKEYANKYGYDKLIGKEVVLSKAEENSTLSFTAWEKFNSLPKLIIKDVRNFNSSGLTPCVIIEGIPSDWFITRFEMKNIRIKNTGTNI